MFSFPSSLERHAGPRGPALKWDSIGKNTFYICYVRHAPWLGESKTIQVEPDDRVVIPFPPEFECLIEEISLDKK